MITNLEKDSVAITINPLITLPITIPYDIKKENNLSEKNDNHKVSIVRCPDIECRNVDCRFMLKEQDISNSTIIITKYASSEYELKCLCCSTEFRFNVNKSFMEIIKYELHNYCYIPLS